MESWVSCEACLCCAESRSFNLAVVMSDKTQAAASNSLLFISEKTEPQTACSISDNSRVQD